MSRSRIVARIDAVETWSNERFPMDIVRNLVTEFGVPTDDVIALMQEEIRRCQAAGTWERQLADLARLRQCDVTELRAGGDAFLRRRS
jgi:hypothetical protein